MNDHARVDQFVPSVLQLEQRPAYLHSCSDCSIKNALCFIDLSGQLFHHSAHAFGRLMAGVSLSVASNAFRILSGAKHVIAWRSDLWLL